MKKIGLVLSGGGARGAYQVGVLSAIAEISRDLGLKNPFAVYTGVSAGAINTAYLASGSQDFYETTQGLINLWTNLTADQVFYTDPISLGKMGFQWLEDISVGRLKGRSVDRSLLDTTPLRDLLKNNINFDQIQRNIASGKLRAAAVTTMDYQTATGVTFVQGAEDIKMWSKPRRYSERAQLRAEHVMASSAIPLLFPPVQVAMSFYGDGCIRNQSPCGPAIDLGAQTLIVIGVRKTVDVLEYEASTQHQNDLLKPPSVAKVVNVLLNAVMLDGIEVDLERLEHINKLIQHMDTTPHAKHKNASVIDYCVISPSVDIAKVAQEYSQRLPRIIRFLIRTVGTLQDAKEIISYLLFEPEFCSRLIEIGYHDGLAQRDQLEKCLIQNS